METTTHLLDVINQFVTAMNYGYRSLDGRGK